MDIHTNIPLKNYVTMRIGGSAHFLTETTTPEELATVCRNAKKQSVILPIFILGGGSNVIVRDSGFSGVVIRMRISGFDIIADDAGSTTIRIGAGENWDSVVKRSVDLNLSGIEAMSGIPGTAGAAPIQNMGAYGQEIADTLQSLEAYDRQTDNVVTLQNSECEFAYRNSIFRDSQAGRYIILFITLKLSKDMPKPPFYESLQKYLDDHGIKIFTPQVIRASVLDIRSVKLPDPAQLPNSGSFFKNPIIETWQLKDIKAVDPDAPSFEMGDGQYKIPAGWLIEQSGLKGQLLHGIRVYDKNALILVNESAKTYQDLAQARDEIITKVRDKFKVQLEQEPLEI